MSLFVLMAGGTGGHLFPAMALAQELGRRGHEVDLMTDHRVAAYGEDFPARRVHIVPSATPSVGNPLKFLKAGTAILRGVGTASAMLRRIGPDAVVGFGGYPTFPPFMAASLLGIPGILHEQNAVMGRANRALARRARILALSVEPTRHAERFATERRLVGNPVRDRVQEAAAMPYPSMREGEPIRLVVFGGSQGARAFADLVPPAVALLPETLRQRLSLVQQCRPEDLDRVAEAYRQAKVNVELSAFFDDLPERMARAHLVFCRSGASSIAELGVLGRPAILVPLPGSIEGDQKANALVVEAAGGGWLLEQLSLSPDFLASRLQALLTDPRGLETAAARARSLGRPRAVNDLADLAESLVGAKARKASAQP